MTRVEVWDNGRAVGELPQDPGEVARDRAAGPELGQGQSLWPTMIEQSPDGFMLIDSGGCIVTLNEAMASLLGCRPARVIGRHYRQVFALFSLTDPATIEGDKLITAIERGLLNEDTPCGDVSLGGREGRPLAVSAWPFRADGDGSPMVVLSLRAMNGRGCPGLDALRQELIGSISHELRTPLTVIKGFVELMLRSGAQLTEEQKKNILGMMRESVKELCTLVENVVYMARLEGEAPEPPSSVDLARVTAEVVETLGSRFPSRREDVSLDLTPDFGPVFGHQDQLRQMILQLVSNSLNYSPPGSSVYLRGYNEDGDVVLTIRDQGAGITSTDQASIFDPFFRSEHPRTEGIPGGGIGLSIVRKVVERHRGTVALESEEGAGTTFTVRLPLKEERYG